MEQFLLKCPNCGSTETIRLNKLKFKCLKCGHIWTHPIN